MWSVMPARTWSGSKSMRTGNVLLLNTCWPGAGDRDEIGHVDGVSPAGGTALADHDYVERHLHSHRRCNHSCGRLRSRRRNMRHCRVSVLLRARIPPCWRAAARLLLLGRPAAVSTTKTKTSRNPRGRGGRKVRRPVQLAPASQAVMRAVAERLTRGLLAAAQPHLLAHLGGERDRGQPGALDASRRRTAGWRCARRHTRNTSCRLRR